MIKNGKKQKKSGDLPKADNEQAINSTQSTEISKNPTPPQSNTSSEKSMQKSSTASTTVADTPSNALSPDNEYTGKDYQFLCENENMRYNKSSKKVGHAVLVKQADGEEVALQYKIPTTTEAPEVRPLENFERITRYGLTRYRATSPNRTRYYATRYNQAVIGEDGKERSVDIAYFSPDEKGKEPFWGSAEKNVPLLNQDLDEAIQDEFEIELQETANRTRAGQEVLVHPESVRWRDAHKTRNPDQNTVMGGSAKDAYDAFFSAMTDELSEEAKEIMKRAIDAPLRDAFKSNYRPEWLHAVGWSLTPRDKDPQKKENLGAAPKWANTEMMVLERIAKWFALKAPETYQIKIKPLFQMLMDSDLIEKIKFEVTIQEKQKFIKFLQEIHPFKKYQLFRKATDLAQATAIANNVLKGLSPISEHNVVDAAKSSPVAAQAAADKPAYSFFKDKTTSTTTATSGAQAMPTAPVINKHDSGVESKSGPITKEEKKHGVRSKPVDEKNHNDKLKHKYPTYFRFERSLIQLESDWHEYNYDEPWVTPTVHTSFGTGFVIEREGKKYIVTNAHVVENTAHLTARFANQKHKYETRTKCVSYQSDLALVEVDDPKFQEMAQPVELGDMVSIEDSVQTVGFPMGGNELSTSKGIVSRIEVGNYCQSGLDMIQVGIDAAVNPGNSGGPVFSDGKVVGVAFQGYDRQGLGFMIPTPIVQHFLTEAFNRKQYSGYPILPWRYQTLSNASLRKFHGLHEDQSGIMITKIDELSDAFKKLNKNDIVLEIDGLPISNEGTVDIPGIGNNIDMVHVTHMKFIGDTVKLKVLRHNDKNTKREIHEITVVLDNVPLQTKKVPQTEWDKMPTYFIGSGISFTPLTYNYMEGRGAELEDVLLVEQGCLLKDVPKKSPNEQIIVINDILNCKETADYDDFINQIVKSINGIPIKNINDVVRAIESNENPIHHIEVASGRSLVVKNMTSHEHAVLLKKYHILRDRSEDLEALNIEPHPSVVNSIESIAKSSPEKDDIVLVEEDDEVIELASESSTEDRKQKSRELSIADMTGYKKYLGTIDKMEKFYKQFEGEEDEDLDFEALSSEEDSLELEEDMEDVKPKMKNAPAMNVRETASFRFNANQNKRNRVIGSDEEESVPHKVQKR